MEVHAHTHNAPASGGTGRKKWSHYFWEFFMLFLAVIAGFLVENQREHYIEDKRASVLAASIYTDFKRDTAALNAIIQYTDTRVSHLDSFITELKSIPVIKNDSILSLRTAWLVRFQPLVRTKETYEQAKNSGMLRYFNLSLVNLLTAYDVLAEETRFREIGEYNVLNNDIIPYVQEFMNFETVHAIYFNQPFPKSFYFNINDLTKANVLINKAVAVKINRTRLTQQYEKMKKKADEIVVFLKKEYHLK